MADRYQFPPERREPELALPPIGERLLPAAAAEYLGVTEATLRNWRTQRRGPPYWKLGRIFYGRRELEKWALSRRVVPRCR